MTVYVVTAGEYSDYHIEAVFSTHSGAVAYMGEFADEFNDIETYELDSLPKCNLVRRYVHWLTGTGEDYKNATYSNVTESDEEVIANGRGRSSTRELTCTHQRSTDAVFYGESYISAEHAKKLAFEERQKYLREHS